MSRRKNIRGSFWLRLISALILLFSLTGLLGAWGFFPGKWIYVSFSNFMGKPMAWVGLFCCSVLTLLIWIFSEDILLFLSVQSSKPISDYNLKFQKKPNKTSSEPVDCDPRQKPMGLPLPGGKLVSLQGFDQYFSSPEWVEMKDIDGAQVEEMKEMGRDFPSYFGTGQTLFPRKLPKLTLLKGLEDYIEEVDQEKILKGSSPEQDRLTPTEIASEKPFVFTSVFKSYTDQEEFLAQFKSEGNSVKLEMCDSQPKAVGKSESRNENDFSTDLEFAADLKAEPLKTSTSSKGIAESFPSLSIAAALELKPNHGGQETQLDEEMIQLEKAIESEIVSSAERISQWTLPDFNLLEPVPHRVITQDIETPKQLEKVLLDFGVKAKVVRVTRGPVITRYELVPAPGVKISKIVNLSDDIALSLAARDVRIEAPIPGKAAIGIEVPNKQARSVPLREVLETENFGRYPSKLKVALGKDIADQPIIADLIKMPHLLVAGATGSGKSVCITSIINSILYNATPDEVKFLLVDPKMVELSHYNGIPHLLAPVVVDPKKAASALKWIVKEMENRYELFAAAGVRDIDRFNKLKAGETDRAIPALPLIVVIIDELADLMMVAAGEVEEAICRLAQMARAAGIHLVIATQRPSVDVITGVIKANIPSRISFAVSSQIDSRTILDAAGAEKLIGQGDMLYSPLGVNKAMRVQGCLVTDDEVQRVISHWKRLGKPEYLDPERLFSEATVKSDESNGSDDALFMDAGLLFIRTGMASVSFLQRRLKLGYTRAARLMDMFEERGVVGAYEGSKPRQVLLTLEEFNERFG